MKKNEKGVLAIEASIVLCALTLFMLFLFNFATVYRAENMVSHATLQTADAVALESYLREMSFETDAQKVLFWANRINGVTSISEESFESLRTADLQSIAKEKFTLAIGSNAHEADGALRDLCVKGGLNGVDLSASYVDLNSNDVIIKADYTIKLRFPVFGVQELRVSKAAKAKTAGEILFGLRVIPEQQIMGTAAGSGKYNMGTQVQISAEENYGYDFVSWDDGNTENPRTITVAGAQTYVAQFRRHNFGVNLFIEDTTAADGRVKGSNAYGTVTALSSGAAAVGGGEYSYQDTVTVSAEEKPGYEFLCWRGSKVSDTGIQPIDKTQKQFDVYIDGTYDLTAVYQPLSYSVSVDTDCDAAENSIGVRKKGTSGYSKSITVEYGSKIQLKASELSGYTFLGWYKDDQRITDAKEKELLVPLEGGTYEAKYEKNPIITLKTVGHGTVKIVANGKTKCDYKKGTSVEIQAIPNSGYYFVSWDDGDGVVSWNARHRVTVNSDIELTATFKKYYSVTVSAGEGGTATGGGTQFKDNDTAIIKATANTGYHFVKWQKSINGGASYTDVSTNAQYTVSVTSNVRYRAIFAKNVYTVSFNVNGGRYAIASIKVEYGQTISNFPKPVPNGKEFVSWQLDGKNVSSVKVTSDITLVAKWQNCSGHTEGHCGQRHWLDSRHNGYWNAFNGAGHRGWGSGHYQYFRTCCICTKCGIFRWNYCGSCTSWKGYTWVNVHGLGQMDNIWSNS